MKKRQSLILLVFFIILSILVKASTPGSINSCQTLNTAGVYTLNQSINVSSTCFTVTTSNVTILGAGFSINGDTGTTDYGITSTAFNNITINNLIINSFGTGIYLIRINDSSIVSTIAYNSSQYGYFLTSSNNLVMEHNLANYSADNGIRMTASSNNNTLYNNTVINNGNSGFFLSGSLFNNFTSNNATNNTNQGFDLSSSSSNNTLYNNFASFNSISGIYVRTLSINNTIEANTLKNNTNGIRLDVGNNTVRSNNVSLNTNGIYLVSNANNTIYGNWIYSNINYGINLEGAATINNLVYNNFFNNTDNYIFNAAGTNLWNVTLILGTNIMGGPYVGGNFWANNTIRGFSQNTTVCPDTASNDGICDLNYTLKGGNKDYYPLTIFSDIIPPSITVSSPQNTNYTVSNNITINFSATDLSPISARWYSNGSVNISYSDASSAVLANGNFTFKFYANDTAGNINFTYVNFTVNIDTVSPIVTIKLPLNTTYRNQTFNFNISLNENGSALFSLDGGTTNYSMSTNNGQDFNYTLNVSDGEYLFKVFANDTIGNNNFTGSISFKVDTAGPRVNITSPTATNYNINNYIVNISLNEAGYCEYSLNGGTTNKTLTNNGNISFNSSESNIANGDYTLIAYCNDSAGNINYTQSVNFTVLVSATPSQPVTFGGSSGAEENIKPKTEDEKDKEYCGNGKCSSGENSYNCFADCKPICGNEKCEKGETNKNCITDCGTIDYAIDLASFPFSQDIVYDGTNFIVDVIVKNIGLKKEDKSAKVILEVYTGIFNNDLKKMVYQSPAQETGKLPNNQAKEISFIIPPLELNSYTIIVKLDPNNLLGEDKSTLVNNIYKIPFKVEKKDNPDLLIKEIKLKPGIIGINTQNKSLIVDIENIDKGIANKPNLAILIKKSGMFSFIFPSLYKENIAIPKIKEGELFEANIAINKISDRGDYKAEFNIYDPEDKNTKNNGYKFYFKVFGKCGDNICEGEESELNCILDCPAKCGNNICAPGENINSCPADCPVKCGDQICSPNENSSKCSIDCPTKCGNKLCEWNEQSLNCPADCKPVCGDGVCDVENGELKSCSADCPICGNKACEPMENPKTCPEDCCGGCGDGICKGYDCGENPVSCANDCGTACGNTVCDKGENPKNCPEDCAIAACGNSICEASDGGAKECPVDCGTACGDGVCSNGEDYKPCPNDCGFCGDGLCSKKDLEEECNADCKPVCGDGVCAIDEAYNCQKDCSSCGNLICDKKENMMNCPVDCVKCGDNICFESKRFTEDYKSCPNDCGSMKVLMDITGKAIKINKNVASIEAMKKLNNITQKLKKTFEKISAKLNISSDDSVGLGESKLVCGNNICELNEDCPQDCNDIFAPVCGNKICDMYETIINCPGDCLAQCGNNRCETGETKEACQLDCSYGTCDNALCEFGESPSSCFNDCCGKCGDGFCQGYSCGENPKTCSMDCGTACGDNVCDKGENPKNCQEDCGISTCGNGICTFLDGGPLKCPIDCGTACGDLACTPGETQITCPIDCGYCGDNICSPDELNLECALDCLNLGDKPPKLILERLNVLPANPTLKNKNNISIEIVIRNIGFAKSKINPISYVVTKKKTNEIVSKLDEKTKKIKPSQSEVIITKLKWTNNSIDEGKYIIKAYLNKSDEINDRNYLKIYFEISK